ncbi:unnamed protein product [Cylicocyclus nassatus]|uniref:RNA-directed DNA polymerase n=1 Tax=Cylicocyclus nassatus TaxID=53992 RepID=A0AA36GP36_CYLNA|nr:unnamed protein product [Cylicocyclus nassatus]
MILSALHPNTPSSPNADQVADNYFAVDLSKADISNSEKVQLQALFCEFRDRISHDSYDLGSYDTDVIHIKTTTETPPHRFRPTRIPVKFQKELDAHINKLLEAGRIKESDTPWVHNTVLVKKRDGSLRVCLDFRPLNEITVPDYYPLPRIEDILQKVAGHKFYTSLDLASGYMQLLLSPESQTKCGWATHRGIYQFVYLPFGLKNAGAYFCRAMSRILAGLEENCLAYLDDIVVFNKDFPSHLNSLRKVLLRFRDFNIKISGKKLVDIARARVTFLGHEISGDNYYPCDRNLQALKNLPVPSSPKEVKRFIGMANFFRKFIQNFAEIAAPLYELTKDKVKFVWTSRQQEAFQELRDKLLAKPCLCFPQDKDFILHTDGSQTAVGAALLQQAHHDDKTLVAVGYFSKGLSDSQREWSPTHIELFAMVSALRFFKATIYGHLTRIFSDHRPLTYLLKHNKTHDNLARWVIELQSYNVTIEYLKGSSNVIADCLSRSVDPSVRFQDNTPETEDIIDFPNCLALHTSIPFSIRSSTIYLTSPLHIKPYDILLEQKKDPTCKSLMSFLETGRFPTHIAETEKSSWLALTENCRLRPNGCLYHLTKLQHKPNSIQERLFLPEHLQEPVFLAFHSSATAGGHFNWRKTLAKISRKYFWPHMSEQIFALVKACELCQRKRTQACNQEQLLPIVSSAIFHKVYMDLTGPLPTSDSGNKYVLALIDHFSKYVIVAPLTDCTAVTVAHAILTECILKFGVMTQLVSDNASYFKGELISELGRLLRIGRYFTIPYHHEVARMSESFTPEQHPDPAESTTENTLAQQQEEAMERGSSILSETVQGADPQAASISHLSTDSGAKETDMQASPAPSTSCTAQYIPSTFIMGVVDQKLS